MMFSKDKFIEECLRAVGEGPQAVQDVMARAMSNPGQIIAAFGSPQHAGIDALYRSPQLTIINFTWAPYMSLMPHNHQMFSVVGIYSGREDNIFWRREEMASARNYSIEAAGARSLGVGDVVVLDKPTIHSVINPIGKMTRALHVYGGDFFAPDEPRSEWEHETLQERPWDVERVKGIFRAAELRSSCTPDD